MNLIGMVATHIADIWSTNYKRPETLIPAWIIQEPDPKWSNGKLVRFPVRIFGNCQAHRIDHPEIESLLANGSTQRFIAQRYHTTEANLHNWLKKNGMKMPKAQTSS
jgi:hypothetical protein